MATLAMHGAPQRSGLIKVVESADLAVADISDGSCILIGGFGGSGFPSVLRDALVLRRPRRVTVVCNNADVGSLAYDEGLVKIICSYPVGDTAKPVLDGIESGRIELELTPQGTLAERLRAGGSGLGGVLTPTGVGLEFAGDERLIEVDGASFILARPIRGDVALIRAHTADTYGNLVFRHAGRNFNPIMAMAARVTIAEVAQMVDPGAIDPNDVDLPGAFVDRVVVVG